MLYFPPVYFAGGCSITGAALTDGTRRLTSRQLFTVHSVSQEATTWTHTTLFHSALLSSKGCVHVILQTYELED